MSDIVKLPRQIPPAVGVCPECVEKTEVNSTETLVRIYCEHNRAGASMNLGPEAPIMWLIFSPIPREEFYRATEQSSQDQMEKVTSQAPANQH